MEVKYLSTADKVIAEASRTIWGYVVRSIDTEQNAIFPAEAAFEYCIYHYAVMDILESWYIEEDVRKIFIPSAAFLLQADPKKTSDASMLVAMQDFVNKTLEWLKEFHPDFKTMQGAKTILSLKLFIERDEPISDLYSYEPPEFDCLYYLKNVKALRAEIPEVIKTVFKNDEPAQKGAQNTKKKLNVNWNVLSFLGIIIALCILFILFNTPQTNSASNHSGSTTVSTIASTESTVPKYKALTPPANGTIIKPTTKSRVAPLEIETSGSGYFCFILCNAGTKNREMVFFGHAGKTVKLDVPLGRYDLYYAFGDTWYGSKHLFGDDTVRRKCDTTLYFYEDSRGYSGYTLTLYPVYDGNMDTLYVNEDDFP